MRGAEHQCQHARRRLFQAKAQLAQEPECYQRRKNVDQNVGAVADHNAAHGGIVFVIGEDRPVRNPRPQKIGGQHQQRLPDAIPAIKPPSPAMQAKLGILVGENLRLRGPDPMRGLQPVRRVGGPQLARLHHKSKQPRRQTQEEKRIAQPVCETRSHCLDGNSKATI